MVICHLISVTNFTETITMNEILLRLLDSLENIGHEFEELGDSDVRQLIGDAVMDGYIRTNPDFILPLEYGMYSTRGNEAVRATLGCFIEAAKREAAQSGLTGFRDRLASVQNRAVQTRTHRDYEDYWGHTPTSLYDDAGNVIQAE